MGHPYFFIGTTNDKPYQITDQNPNQARDHFKNETKSASHKTNNAHTVQKPGFPDLRTNQKLGVTFSRKGWKRH